MIKKMFMTVQEKNITFPTDSKLPMHAIVKPAKFAKHHGIPLRQPYARKAKQTAKKLLLQEKNTPKKIYSLHELGMQCIGKGKGKDRIRYEFGNKSAIVTTNNRNRIVNVEDLPDNPYDGHTLNVSLAGAEKIVKVSVTEANVDKGCRGHDYKGTATIRIAGSSNRGLIISERKRKKRRSAIEPVIGHLKADHRLGRCFLKGRIGDGLNLIGSAAGLTYESCCGCRAEGYSPLRRSGRRDFGPFGDGPTLFDIGLSTLDPEFQDASP